MNKFFKITLGIGVLALTCAVIVKIVKDEKKKLEKNKKNIEEGLENLGLSKEKVEKEFSEEEEKDNFVKALYHSMEFGSLDGDLWDRDLIRIHSKKDKDGNILGKGVLECENVIHVMQSDTEDGGKNLEFYFEIPSSTYRDGSYKHPKLKDYIRKFKDAAYYMSKNITRTSTSTPSGSKMWELVGFYVVSYKISGRNYPKVSEGDDPEPIVYQRMVRIPEEDYKEFADPERNKDGLFGYFKTMEGSKNGIRNFSVEFYDPSLKPGEEVYDLAVETPILMFKISFPISGIEVKSGISLESALRCIKYLTEEIIVARDGRLDSTSVKYNHIQFHSKNYDYPELGFDFLRYYTVDIDDEEDPKFSQRRIVSEDYEYCFDD